MTAFSRFVVCAAALSLATATQAFADPIQVTGGSLTAFWNGLTAGGLAPTAITGTNGFSLTGDALPGEGRMDIFDGCATCRPAYVPPASTQSIGAFIGTFEATATFEGASYPIHQGIDTLNGLAMELTGSVMLPAFSESQTATTAPFRITAGNFFAQSGPISEKLTGGGIATLALTPFHFPDDPFGPDWWRVDQIRYEFSPSAVTPEPATLTLAALGLMGAGFRARRRGAAL
jgi:hypothetical protein